MHKKDGCNIGILMLLKGSILPAVLLIAFTSHVNAQNGKVYLKGQSKREIAANIVTGDFGDAVPVSKKRNHHAQKSSYYHLPARINRKVDRQTGYRIMADDRYLKTKDKDKRYEEFQVFDVKGMDMNAEVQGLLTNSLDRDKRYSVKGLLEKKTFTFNGFISKVDSKGVELPTQKVHISCLRLNDKVFVIFGENDYRYMDGKRLQGGQKLVEELMKGKPVTEITFFYELKKAGVLDSKLTLAEFGKMDMIQKQNVLNGGSVAAN